MRSIWMAGLVSVSVAFGSMACSLQTEDGSKYREPLPAQGSVALALPGSQATTGTRTLDFNGNGGGAVSSDAEFYTFSRTVTDGIDQATAGILGAIWLVAQTTPTSVEPNKATWGPSQGTALEPVAWRLVVTEGAADEYDYVLDGRPKASTSDADFKTILRGHGYGKAHALHDTGWFQWDSEAERSLDPASVKTKDRGTVKVTYDIRQFPKTIGVELRPNDGTGQIDAKVQHLAQGAGVLDVDGQTDIESDGQKDGKLENVKIKSQWNSSGAGRADATVAGGSLPIASVSVVECWSSSFLRSYYKDSVDSKPTVGSESACPSF